MSYRLLNNITGWIVFAIATVVYIMTLEPTTSLWDCGEYITTANQMEVGHPPGAPLFMMLGRVFSAFSSPENAAWAVNAMSGISSSFSILFLFWSITMLARKLAPNYDKLEIGDKFAIMASGAVGALAYTFTDSFWFSAVEGEVYAMSSFFTAVVFWAILKWETVAHKAGADRWLILIFFLMGLSIGVHLLNLLAIPAICFVYYFKKFKYSFWGTVLTGVLSIVILGMIQAVIIPKTVDIAAWFERFFVNSIGTGFNVGSAMFALFLILLIVLGVWLSNKYKKPMLNTVVMSFAVLMIGYSSFSMIVIRSNANPPLDENNPETLTSLSSYLKREQYGSWPIAYGQYWNAPVIKAKHKNPTYMKAFVLKKKDRTLRRDDGSDLAFNNFRAAELYNQENGLDASIVPEYIVSDDGKFAEQVFDPDFCTVLPRMYRAGEGPNYKVWSDYVGDQRMPLPAPAAYRNQFSTMDQIAKAIENQMQMAFMNGQFDDVEELKKNLADLTRDGIYKPTFGENMTYMFRYQFGWMYFRYFLWNFAGRQNDLQGYGGVGGGVGKYLEGNWLSGVPFVDEARLGPQENLPHKVVDNKGYNRYYFLPLILALIGLIYHLIYKPKDWFVVMLLFFFTGLAICIYLNQKPAEPRERDYAYAASFYAFSIWIGLGVWALYDVARKINWKNYATVAGASFGFGLITWMINGAFGRSIMFMALVALILIGIMLLLKKAPGIARGVIALVLAAPVPIILASENWDDHDRSNRYTARDIAKAYLDSCDENAILFTHGDNDTFPLWYVQEVEKYRTDVRVVNLSLLGTDWHVNQSKRKAYESEPVPFTAEEYQYRQGTRDVVYFYDDRKQSVPGYVPAIQVYEDIMDPSSLKKIENVQKSQYTFHQRKVSIPVNKKNAIESGIADTSMVKLPLEDKLEWGIKGTMIKSDLMVLDLLAHYDWTRPIYFAGNAAAHSNLQKYFQMEGLTYKLTPFLINGRGYTFHEDKTFRRLTDETAEDGFKWGNMNKEGVLVDYYTMRMVYNLRGQFSRFSDELIQTAKLAEMSGDTATAKRKRDRAEQILDRCFEVMPMSNVAPDDLCYHLLGNYYDLSHDDPSNAEVAAKADALAQELIRLNLDDLEYFSSLDSDWTGKQIKEIGRTYLHLEIIRDASLTVQERQQQNVDQELNMKVLANTKFAGLKAQMGQQFNKMMRNVDKELREKYRARIASRSIFPRTVAMEWFPEWDWARL